MSKTYKYLTKSKTPDTTSLMFAEMASIKMFPVEGCNYVDTQEYKVASRAKAGDCKARKELVQRNYRLVMSMSQKFTNQGLDHMDLVQEGVLGLIRAAEKFDPDLMNKFSTYAYWWIRQAMSRAVMEKSRTVRVPVHITESFRRIGKFKESFYKQFYRYPSPEEISEALDIPVNKVKEIATDTLAMTSLNKPITEDGQELMNVIALEYDIEDEIVLTDMREILQRYISQNLTPIEANILSGTTGFPLEGDSPVATLDYKQLSDILGLTREAVRAIRARAMRKLRAKLPHSQLMGLKDCLT